MYRLKAKVQVKLTQSLSQASRQVQIISLASQDESKSSLRLVEKNVKLQVSPSLCHVSSQPE